MITYIKNTMHITGEITARTIDGIRYIIYEDGEYYGVYDTIRKTFVD